MIHKDKLKEMVYYVFRELPIEEAKSGNGSYIDIIDTKTTLSFKIVPEKSNKERRITFHTGIDGFLNMYKASEGLMQFTPVRYNGKFLNKDQTKQFWDQTKEKLDKK